MTDPAPNRTLDIGIAPGTTAAVDVRSLLINELIGLERTWMRGYSIARTSVVGARSRFW